MAALPINALMITLKYVLGSNLGQRMPAWRYLSTNLSIDFGVGRAMFVAYSVVQGKAQSDHPTRIALC